MSSAASSKKVIDSKKTVVSKKELNISSLSQSLWLVKIPQIVFDKWSTKRQNEILGTLSITTSVPTPGAAAEKKIVVNLTEDNNYDADEAAASVTDYVLDELSGGVELVPFIHSEETGTFSVRGKISKNCILKPRGDAKYREFCRVRSANALKKTRAIKKMDINDANEAQMKVSIVDFIPPAYVEAKRKISEQKLAPSKKIKGSLDGKDLRSKMFQAFDKKSCATLKEICAVCQATEKDVKDILKDYANYHAKGVYKNFWELKPEYRVQGTDGTIKLPSDAVE